MKGIDKSKKTFDCVELQHEGGRRIAERTAGMTMDEKVAYWAECNDRLRGEIAELRAQKKQATAA